MLELSPLSRASTGLSSDFRGSEVSMYCTNTQRRLRGGRGLRSPRGEKKETSPPQPSSRAPHPAVTPLRLAVASSPFPSKLHIVIRRRKTQIAPSQNPRRLEGDGAWWKASNDLRDQQAAGGPQLRRGPGLLIIGSDFHNLNLQAAKGLLRFQEP